MYCFIRVCNMYCIGLQGCSWWFEIKLNYHPAVICVVSMPPQQIRTNPQHMDQQIFWPLYADSTFSQFVHWVISCDYVIIFVYSVVVWVICRLILFRVLIERVSSFTVSEVCAYETMISMVLLWQWYFHGSVMSCNSKALEPYPCSDSQKHPLTTS